MSDAKDRQQRFHYVDGFRAIASFMIVLHHSISSNVYYFLKGLGLEEAGLFFWNLTGSGVDFFFVISGLVLLRPYLRGQRPFHAGSYFKKRFIRIYPTYIAALILGAASIWYINTFPTWYNEKGIHVSYSVGETLRQALMINKDGVYYNLAWWSVGVEATFYILAPLIVFLFPKKETISNGKTVSIIFLSLIGSVLLQFACDRFFPIVYTFDYSKLILNTGRIVDYPMCFLMGVILAARDFDIRYAKVFMIVGAIMFAGHYIYAPFMHAGYGLFYAGILVYTFGNVSWQRFLSSPFLLWLGERSYSLFLVHLSVFYFVDNITAHFTSHRGAIYGIMTRGLGIPLAIFVAMLLFQFVERRFARGLVTDRMFWPWQYSKLRREALHN